MGERSIPRRSVVDSGMRLVPEERGRRKERELGASLLPLPLLSREDSQLALGTFV